jgi:hypothetical protein
MKDLESGEQCDAKASCCDAGLHGLRVGVMARMRRHDDQMSSRVSICRLLPGDVMSRGHPACHFPIYVMARAMPPITHDVRDRYQFMKLMQFITNP